jgi:hypothetical protein
MAGPRLQGLIDSVVDLCQEVEDVASDLYTKRTIDTATGDTLDIIGEIVGQLRGGLSDDDYRSAIRFRIQLNVSCGQPDIVSDGLKFFTSASRARLTEKTTPAAFAVWCNASVIPDGLYTQMNAIRPAAVQMYLSYVLAQDDLTFVAEGSDPQEGMGYAELSYAPGGALSELVLS